jgi:hypothetical protein
MSQPWDTDQLEATEFRSKNKRLEVGKKKVDFMTGTSTYFLPPMCPYCINRERFGFVPGQLDGSTVGLLGVGHPLDEPLKLGVDVPLHWTTEAIFFILLVATKNVVLHHAGETIGGLLNASKHKVVVGHVHLGDAYTAVHGTGINPFESNNPTGLIIPHPGGAPSPIPPDGEGDEPSVWWFMSGNLEYNEVEHISGDPALDPVRYEYVRYAFGQNNTNLPL